MCDNKSGQKYSYPQKAYLGPLKPPPPPSPRLSLVVLHLVVLEKSYGNQSADEKVILLHCSAPKVGQSAVIPEGTSRVPKDPSCQVWL